MAQPRAVGDREAELVVAERVFGGVVALGVAVSGSGAADVTHGTRTGVGGDGEERHGRGDGVERLSERIVTFVILCKDLHLCQDQDGG